MEKRLARGLFRGRNRRILTKDASQEWDRLTSASRRCSVARFTGNATLRVRCLGGLAFEHRSHYMLIKRRPQPDGRVR